MALEVLRKVRHLLVKGRAAGFGVG